MHPKTCKAVLEAQRKMLHHMGSQIIVQMCQLSLCWSIVMSHSKRHLLEGVLNSDPPGKTQKARGGSLETASPLDKCTLAI